MFCEKCGKQVENTAKFCPYCGYAFQQAPAEAAPVNKAPEVNTAPVRSEAPAKKKGGKGKAIIIALVVLLVAAAGAVAAIFLLGDKDGKAEGAAGEAVINRDYLLYYKNGNLYLNYTENNETILLSDNWNMYNADRSYQTYTLPNATWYNEATGYLYFPDNVSVGEYSLDCSLSRIKLDPDNIEDFTVESVIDEDISYGSYYSVSPDDSLVIYKNTDNDLYYRNLGTDESAQRLEKDVEKVIVDFEKNQCYYNDETELTYVNLETMEKKVIFSASTDGYMYVNYVGDCVIVTAYGENYLIDKNGDKTYISNGNGYVYQVEDKYYFISNDYNNYDNSLDASLFVEDDCYEADRQIGESDSGYWGKVVRDEIRSIVSYASVYSYACDDIYLIEGNEAKIVAENVTSYSQAGTVPVSCYSYPEPSKIITISEIYDEIVSSYTMYSPYDIHDHYVTGAIENAYTKEAINYIIVGDVLNKIEAEGINYISDNVYFSENYVYFEMSIGTYINDYGYESYNTTRIYRAPINSDNTLGQYEVVSDEGGITYLSEDNLFSHGKLTYDESDDYDEWYLYNCYGSLYLNGAFIDSGVDICYAESYGGDDFNKYKDNTVLYVKDVHEGNYSFEADLYFYNGTESIKLEKKISDYELTDGGEIYYIDEGTLLRYGEDETVTISSDVGFILKAEKSQSKTLGW